MDKRAESNFEHLNQTLAAGGVDSALEWLEREFTSEKRYAELFEILKMKARRHVGLGLTQSDEELSPNDPAQEQLEKHLYRACGQVGELLFRDGRPALAWKYFQLVGDRRRAAEFLKAIPPTSENAQDLIDVSLGEGVDPTYGIELTLRFLGTCNAITSMDQCMPFEKDLVRDASAHLLLRHFYAELTHNLSSVIESREGHRPDRSSLSTLLENRPWLFGGDEFHVDSSHLAATVRLGRMTTQRDGLEIALELCQYGLRLNSSLIGAGETPFEDLFAAHEVYFSAALGHNVEQGLAYFRSRLPTGEPNREVDRRAAEVLVDLNCRNQRWSDALQVSLDWLAAAPGKTGVVPGALEIASRSGQLPKLADWYQKRGDLLMYGVALMRSSC